MKYFKASIVVVLIFILPIGSYLYLRSGFIYRKDALDEMSAQNLLSEQQYSILEAYDTSVISRLHKGVTVFHNVANEKDVMDATFFSESFGKRSDFSLVAFVPQKFENFILDTTHSKILTKIPASVREREQFFGKTKFMLARDSFVRKSYGITEEEKIRLYEHTAIMLPMKGRDKVELKRKMPQ